MLLTICAACAPRYDISYDFDPALKTKPAFAQSKLGICTFEDKRPATKPDYAFFQDTWTLSDDVLVERAPETINRLMVNHFNAAFGKSGTVAKVEQNCGAATIKELIGQIQGNGSAEYVLVGTVAQYTSSMYDKNATARGVLGIIPGMMFLFNEGTEYKTDIKFDNLLLIKIAGPQIVWKGAYKTTTVEPVRVFADRYEYLVQTCGNKTKTAIQSLLDDMLRSADAGFPQKYSIEESKRILNRIKVNKSLSGWNN